MPDLFFTLILIAAPLLVSSIFQVVFKLTWTRAAIWAAAIFFSFLQSGVLWNKAFLRASGCKGDGFKSAIQCPEWGVLTEIAAFQSTAMVHFAAMLLALMVLFFAVIAEVIFLSRSPNRVRN